MDLPSFFKRMRFLYLRSGNQKQKIPNPSSGRGKPQVTKEDIPLFQTISEENKDKGELTTNTLPWFSKPLPVPLSAGQEALKILLIQVTFSGLSLLASSVRRKEPPLRKQGCSSLTLKVCVQEGVSTLRDPHRSKDCKEEESRSVFTDSYFCHPFLYAVKVHFWFSPYRSSPNDYQNNCLRIFFGSGSVTDYQINSPDIFLGKVGNCSVFGQIWGSNECAQFASRVLRDQTWIDTQRRPNNRYQPETVKPNN